MHVIDAGQGANSKIPCRVKLANSLLHSHYGPQSTADLAGSVAPSLRRWSSQNQRALLSPPAVRSNASVLMMLTEQNLQVLQADTALKTAVLECRIRTQPCACIC